MKLRELTDDSMEYIPCSKGGDPRDPIYGPCSRDPYAISGYAGAVVVLVHWGESEDDLFERCRHVLDKQIRAVVPEKECWRVRFEIENFGSAGPVDPLDWNASIRWFYKTNNADTDMMEPKSMEEYGY